MADVAALLEAAGFERLSPWQERVLAAAVPGAEVLPYRHAWVAPPGQAPTLEHVEAAARGAALRRAGLFETGDSACEGGCCRVVRDRRTEVELQRRLMVGEAVNERRPMFEVLFDWTASTPGLLEAWGRWATADDDAEPLAANMMRVRAEDYFLPGAIFL